MVTKLVTFGAFARIEGPVEGLIHVSELVDRRIAHPKEVVREGDLLPLKIVRIERDRHRLGLSLREARDEGARMGFTFTDSGEVLAVPEDIKTEFEEREGIKVIERGPDDYTEAVVAAPPKAEETDAARPLYPRLAAAAPPPPPRVAEPEPPSAMAQASAAAEQRANAERSGGRSRRPESDADRTAPQQRRASRMTRRTPTPRRTTTRKPPANARRTMAGAPGGAPR
jgi:predicted RNA-binding protein with RPS1 domain